MYDILKSVVSAGGYKLAEIQHKIKKLFILGDLTEAQTDELLAMASAGVSADAERPETLAMIKTIADEIEALKSRVMALEGGNDDAGDPDQPEYAEWKPWDGISNDYQLDAIVIHNGKLWKSTFAGHNVWEPGAVGTDALWVEYKPEEA